MSRNSCLIAVMMLFVLAAPAHAGKCKNSMFNPVTEVAWKGLFPIRVGGVQIKGGVGLPENGDGTKNPICLCTDDKGTYMGMEISFWDVNNLAEVVQEAGCSPTVGTSIALGSDGFHGGTVATKTHSPNIFKNVHWIKFPALDILGMLGGMKCATRGGMDYAELTEFNPEHKFASAALALRPETLVFANPAFDLLQPANVVAAHTPGNILDPAYDSMFWLWWDTIYPLTGDKNSPHDLESSSQIAAKQIYKFYGTGMLMDQTGNICKPQMSYTPRKSEWRFQLAKPVYSGLPYMAGQSEFVWGMGGKNPAFKEGNFLLVMFQKRRCCEKIYGN